MSTSRSFLLLTLLTLLLNGSKTKVCAVHSQPPPAAFLHASTRRWTTNAPSSVTSTKPWSDGRWLQLRRPHESTVHHISCTLQSQSQSQSHSLNRWPASTISLFSTEKDDDRDDEDRAAEADDFIEYLTFYEEEEEEEEESDIIAAPGLSISNSFINDFRRWYSVGRDHIRLRSEDKEMGAVPMLTEQFFKDALSLIEELEYESLTVPRQLGADTIIFGTEDENGEVSSLIDSSTQDPSQRGRQLMAATKYNRAIKYAELRAKIITVSSPCTIIYWIICAFISTNIMMLNV